MNASSLAELRACALATLVSDPGQMSTFERVFALLFGGPDPLRDLPLPTAPAIQRPDENSSPPAARTHRITTAGWPGCRSADTGSAVPPASPDEPLAEAPAVHRVAWPPNSCAAVTSLSCQPPSCATWSRSCAR